MLNTAYDTKDFNKDGPQKVQLRTHLAMNEELWIPLIWININTYHALGATDHGRGEFNALRTSFFSGSSIEVFYKYSSSAVDARAFSLWR